MRGDTCCGSNSDDGSVRNNASAGPQGHFTGFKCRIHSPLWNVCATREQNRRYALLVAIVLELMIKFTNDSIDMFDRMIGSMFAKTAQVKAERFHAGGKVIVERMDLLAAG